MGNLLLAGITTALHVPSVEERLLVGKVIGFELILILNLLMWICLKGVIRDKLRVGNKLINSTAMGKLKLIQFGKVGFLSAIIILLIVLNLQISNLFQKLHKEVREETIWALNPRRTQRQHDLGQAWNCRQPLELADRVHMEGKMATKGSIEHRPVRQELDNQKFVDEFQSKGQIRNKSQKQLLEWKPSWQRGGQVTLQEKRSC